MAPQIFELGQDAALRIRNTIYKYSLSHESFTIPTIASLTGYSSTTIAKYVSQMKDSGSLITLDGEDDSRGKGRKATIYAIKLDPCYFLGVDVRSFGLTIGLMNMNGTMVRTDKMDGWVVPSDQDLVNALSDKIREYIESLEDLDISQISGVNVNVRGIVDASMEEALSDALGLPAFVENDTKAMAYGEYLTAGLDSRNLLYVNVGWGLGVGIIIDGRLYTGSRGNAGEMGHMPYYNNNVLCHCGKKGCLETEVSISAIVRKITDRINEGESSVLSDKVHAGESLTLADFLEAMEKEDPLCIEVVSWTAQELGKHLSGMISLLDPDSVIVAGPLTALPSYFFMDRVNMAIRQFTPKFLNKEVSVGVSQIGEDAGVTGACLIARDKALMNQPFATGSDQIKTIEVPFIEKLEDMESWKLDSSLLRNTAGAAVDTVNWPDLYPYAPKCLVRTARSHDYLAVSFNVSGMDLRATEMKDNGRSWEDSCCEFFVAPGSSDEYYNIEITCIGYIRIGKGTGRNDRVLIPDSEVAKVKRWSTLEPKRYEEEGGNYNWGVTALIPFSVIGLDPANLPSELRVNFYKCGDLTAHPHFLSWNPINCEKPDFHRPECFGKLILR